MDLLHTYPGTNSYAAVSLRNNRGDTLRLPLPFYDIGKGVVAIPEGVFTDHELTFDLNQWELWDMHNTRRLNVRFTGSPERAEVLQLAAAYVKHARHFDDTDLYNWFHANGSEVMA